MSISIYIVGIIVCVMLSAFFSASEMSYSACNKVRLEHERDNGNKKAGLAVWIANKFDDALSTILVGNNLVNIAASSMGSVAVMLALGEKYTTWSTSLRPPWDRSRSCWRWERSTHGCLQRL